MPKSLLSEKITYPLKKSSISSELISHFSQFLQNNPLLEQQAIYLLQEKKKKIQEVVEDLYGISTSIQSNWSSKNTTEVINSKVVESFVNQLQKSEKFDNQKSKFFQDFKQEQGINKLSLEVGIFYCIIRVDPFKDENFQQKFRWRFLQSKYRKTGWSVEKPVKNITKELSENKYLAGQVITSYLKNHPIIKKENYPSSDELPNTFVFDGEESYYLFSLFYGYPFLYFHQAKKTLFKHKTSMCWKLVYREIENYNLIYATFFVDDQYFDFEIHRNNIYLLGGVKQAIVIAHNHWNLKEKLLSDAMMQEVIRGVIVEEKEWQSFLQKWEKYYSIPIEKDQSIENFLSDFSVKDYIKGSFWLKLRKSEEKPIFHPDAKIPKLYLSTDVKKYNWENIGLKIKDFEDYEWCLQNPQECTPIVKLFQYFQYIFQSPKENGFYIIHKVVASKILFLSKNYPYFYNHKNQQLFKNLKYLHFGISLEKDPNSNAQYFLKGRLYEKKIENNKLKLALFPTSKHPSNIVGVIPSYLVYDDKIFVISNLVSGSFMRNYQATILARQEDIEDFYRNVYPILKIQHLYFFDPNKFLDSFAIFYYKLCGRLEVREHKEIFIGKLSVIMKTEIGEFGYPIQEKANVFQKKIHNREFSINRNKELEKEIYSTLKEHGWVAENVLEDGKQIFSMQKSKITDFLFHILPRRMEKPIEYYIKKTSKKRKIYHLTPRIISSAIGTGQNQLLELKVDTKKFNIGIRKIIQLWEKKINYIDLGEQKGVVKIDEQWIKNYLPILKHLYDHQEKKLLDNKKIAVNKYYLGLLENLSATKAQRFKKEQSILKITPQTIPTTIKAKLRSYQKEGVNWLCFLRKYHFGGILADDMGLGKTLQALTFFEIIRQKNKIQKKKPHLVVCPTSVVSNWQEEAKKFSPELELLIYYGYKRKKLISQFKKVDLIITSYSLVQKDTEILRKIKYDVILLDEAQNIKNAKTKTNKEVCRLEGRQKISLTGTPIENNVFELWAQFRFLMPELLGSYKNFQSFYAKPETADYDFSLLRKKTIPFILRRIKQNVAQSLPPKTEQTLYCEMYPKQRKLYNHVLSIEKKNILEKIDEKNPTKNIKICFFEALLKLRQICCDPRLNSRFENETLASAKLDFFLTRIEEIVSEGHKVLVFSQFVKMLNLMHQPLLDRNIHFLQLDGSTRKRQQVISTFQNDSNYPVFLISLKAGGVGLNLTAADYVIHYDPWWNSAVINQASDRVYRIGQDKHVFIYSLIMKNSIEEKILRMQKKKQSLFDGIISVFNNFDSMLKSNSIEELFS